MLLLLYFDILIKVKKSYIDKKLDIGFSLITMYVKLLYIWIHKIVITIQFVMKYFKLNLDSRNQDNWDHITSLTSSLAFNFEIT